MKYRISSEYGFNVVYSEVHSIGRAYCLINNNGIPSYQDCGLGSNLQLGIEWVYPPNFYLTSSLEDKEVSLSELTNRSSKSLGFLSQ
jgi:hypothetical protein